ncbi:hypothetical protein M405DRAFT_768189 [Rhizopogon salebrosus TDB-379]|nr:hypothetical protein M405DRAFT_768189 [Rhizopogon salebrosus TDB-379]
MALPPVDRMFITSAWLESILYGVNFVLFGICVYVLLDRKSRAHWVALVSCIFCISIATAHNILSLLRALQAFTNPTIISVPNATILYLLGNTALSSVNSLLYIFNVLAVNLLLIWRLYVVWHRTWFLIVMLILEAAQIATALTAWALILRFGQVFSLGVHDFVNASFAFNLAVTIAVTSGITYRIWHAGRSTSDLTGDNTYKVVMYIVIESGAIYTSSIIVLSGLVMSGNQGGVMGINVNIQIATLALLLLIARLGLGLTHGEATPSETFTTVGPRFAQPIQVNVTKETCTYPMDVDSNSRFTWKSSRAFSNPDVKNSG